jgi:hypothetical protein
LVVSQLSARRFQNCDRVCLPPILAAAEEIKSQICDLIEKTIQGGGDAFALAAATWPWGRLRMSLRSAHGS